MKTLVKRSLALLITFGFVIWIANSGTQWQGSIAALTRLPVLAVMLAILAFVASYLLRAARVYDEFREQTGARFSAILRLTLVHNAMVNILPFRSGEAAFPVLLNRWFGVTTTRAVVALLWLRIQDAFVVLALAAFVWPDLHLGLRLAWVLAVVVAAWLIPAWAARHPELETRAGRFAASLHRIREALAESTHQPVRGWVWTLANWSIKLLAEAWLLAVLIGAGLATGLAGALGVELAAILPIQGVAGFGTYEAGGAALLAPHGINFQQGLNAALALHLFVIACSLLAGGLAASLLPGAPAPALNGPPKT